MESISPDVTQQACATPTPSAKHAHMCACSVNRADPATNGFSVTVNERVVAALDCARPSGRIRLASQMTPSSGNKDPIGEYATHGLAEAIGIVIIELSPSRVIATMPVDERTRQPYGLLHGGASVALAETVASLGAIMNVDQEHFRAVGLEINANHIRAKMEGIVRATATPLHIGRLTHVWSVEIRDEEGRAVCISRCTVAIVPTK
jgi:1,4-dihydroxy-2-naphthoyl-CoA hydrolase